MTVQDLIDELQKYDKGMEVCFPWEYPCDFCEIDDLRIESVQKHDKFGYDYASENGKQILVLCP